jgi:hypothetical protein
MFFFSSKKLLRFKGQNTCSVAILFEDMRRPCQVYSYSIILFLKAEYLLYSSSYFGDFAFHTLYCAC